MDKRLHGLRPLINGETKVLILGSFPSVKSLENKEYYANPRNQFWPIMSDMLNTDLVSKTYPDKVRLLLQHQIGLWDIIKSCKRVGSSDASIDNETMNNINETLNTYRSIKVIAVNGSKAKSLLKKYQDINANILFMPSTSPAHAIPYRDKKNRWKQLLKFLYI